MEYPTIVINRTKEELRKYNIFSAIERKPFRKYMQYFGPIFGIAQLIVFFFYQDLLYLVLGVFLTLYPFMIRFTIIRASDQSYTSNNLDKYEINITFNDHDFITATDEMSQKLEYSDIYRIYNRKDDIIIYLSKLSGLYINKETYGEEIIAQILELLTNAVPERIK